MMHPARYVLQRWSGLVGLALAGHLSLACAATAKPVSQAEVRAAAARALPLIERSSAFALQERACFTCHHGAHPSLVLHDAWARGFTVSTNNFEDQLARAYRGLVEDAPRFKDGWSIAGTADGPGTALWMLANAGWQPDTATAAAAEFFLNDTKAGDHWAPPMKRPPTVGSSFTTTYLVLRALQHPPPLGFAARTRTRSNAAGQWLLATPARDTEDSVYRLRALRLLDVDEEAFQKELRELLAVQADDGGWPQKLDTASDAYATGTVLAALYDTGALKVSDAAFQRGLRHLLTVQATEGSWHVRKRTHDVQPFFDSSFPHGVDQFISISATSWATYALLRAVPTVQKKPYLAAHPTAVARVLAAAKPDAERSATEPAATPGSYK
jgi:N-acyl-D-amino-acid deacylase